MNGKKTQATLIGVVAAYMLYIAYSLFENRNDPETTMSPVVNTLCIVFFVVAAIALIIYAVISWRKSGEKDDDDEDGDTLK